MNAPVKSLLPPNRTSIEAGLEQAMARYCDITKPIEDLWDPQAAPADLLPFMAWGLSIDFWNPEWSEAEKRDAIAGSIEHQRRKGTRKSLRDVIDRYDSLIDILEWHEVDPPLDPHSFKLLLPSQANYTQQFVDNLLADIAATKPVRSHMGIAQFVRSQLNVGLFGGALVAGFARTIAQVDMQSAADISYQNYLQTNNGEPIELAQGGFLET